jgi:hypothetical protein
MKAEMYVTKRKRLEMNRTWEVERRRIYQLAMRVAIALMM